MTWPLSFGPRDHPALFAVDLFLLNFSCGPGLNLSAAFLAGLGFWAGIPWAIKMPLGHIVDLIWNKKNILTTKYVFLTTSAYL